MTMAINALWNKRIGPGGRTRLVHKVGAKRRFCGPESASTTVVKTVLLSGMITAVTGHFINANDNVAFVAANDNAVVAVRAAA